MIDENDMKPILLSAKSVLPTAQHVQSGLPIPKVIRVKNFSPEEWEAFIEEWAHTLEDHYPIVRKFGGSGDMGIDVAGFTDDERFKGPWDNYQCKRYDHALQPGDIYEEIGKVIYYSWRKEYTVPRRHFFAGSQGIGKRLEKLLGDPEELKKKVRTAWPVNCQNKITTTQEILLAGELLTYFDNFDFTIFGSKSVLDLISQHEKSSHHAIRFGGGLPPRPQPVSPPMVPASIENRYVQQLLDAYGDHKKTKFTDHTALSSNSELMNDFSRQRERFYHAEALRNFSRDTVPDGTFAALQEEIFQGVIDICENIYPSGLERMRATVAQASQINSTNPLAPATKVQDRQGICHQLANIDRLTWVPNDE